MSAKSTNVYTIECSQDLDEEHPARLIVKQHDDDNIIIWIKWQTTGNNPTNCQLGRYGPPQYWLKAISTAVNPHKPAPGVELSLTQPAPDIYLLYYRDTTDETKYANAWLRGSELIQLRDSINELADHMAAAHAKTDRANQRDPIQLSS